MGKRIESRDYSSKYLNYSCCDHILTICKTSALALIFQCGTPFGPLPQTNGALSSLPPSSILPLKRMIVCHPLHLQPPPPQYWW